MEYKFFYLFIFPVALFVSCKKSLTASSGENTFTITVKEHKNRIPLAGVIISLYKCSNYDAVFGCMSTTVFARYTTDQKGEYVISRGDLNRANEGIIFSKPQYWDRSGGTGEIPMQPEAWVKIGLKASKRYPDSSFFEIQTVGELGAGGHQSFPAPADSIINFRLIGNEMNKVTWVLLKKDPGCIYYCIRDTLAFGSLFFNPQKFEQLTSSLNY